MYTKYQCKQESGVRKHSDNIHSNRRSYKYTVITECDLILHEYYIIRRHKNMIYKVRKDWKVLVRCKKGESRELIKRCQVRKHLLLIHLLLKESLFLS